MKPSLMTPLVIAILCVGMLAVPTISPVAAARL
jgi:hypothetical protein